MASEPANLPHQVTGVADYLSHDHEAMPCASDTRPRWTTDESAFWISHSGISLQLHMQRHDSFTWSELVRICNGHWEAAPPASDGVTAVWDDTRSLPPGALFPAIVGENTDGHRHIAAAVAAGAGAVCVQADLPAETRALLTDKRIPVLRVQNTLTAFQALAAAHRQRFPQLPVVGITGSCGKTSTKEMLAAVLNAKWPGAVLKTEGNTNNHFGVPRNLLRLTPEHRAAVIEMGTNHPGEIAGLAALVRPTLGVITCVGHAHMEFLGGTDGVAREKGSMLTFLPADGVATFPVDTLHTDILRNLAGPVRVLTYGTTQEADVRICYHGPGDGGYRATFTWRATGQSAELSWMLGGAHQALNAGAAAVIGTLVGLDPAAIAAALRCCQLPNMRMEVLEIQGTHWVNDAYNSNPDSARASLLWFRELTRGTAAADIVVVVGDMRELGAAAATAHPELLQLAQRLFPGAHILPVGSCMTTAAAGLGLPACPDAAAAKAALQPQLRPGAWILLKGSRGIRLETLMPTPPAGH